MELFYTATSLSHPQRRTPSVEIKLGKYRDPQRARGRPLCWRSFSSSAISQSLQSRISFKNGSAAAAARIPHSHLKLTGPLRRGCIERAELLPVLF